MKDVVIIGAGPVGLFAALLLDQQGISVDLYDINGRRVISLFRDQAKFGQNIFTFSTAPLAAGIYFATITSEEKHIYKQKIVKAARP